MRDLSVAVLQMKIEQGCPVANVAHLSQLLSTLHSGELDLLLLPEMWHTGFMTSPSGLKESHIQAAFERALDLLLAESRRLNTAIYGTMIEELSSGKLANCGVWVTPNGVVTRYYKRHLFGPGGESKYFISGDQQVEVEWQGWRLRLSTCYDLRFPVWLRQHTAPAAPYDILLCSANWPKPREKAWEILLRARAIENQCYLLGANRAGNTPEGLEYPGFSFVLNPMGESLSESLEPEETLLRSTLSYDALQSFRARFPVLKDADSYTLFLE